MQLIKYKLVADGSFLWEFELKNGGIFPLNRQTAADSIVVPLYFNPGPGLFAGEWVTFKADYVSEFETNITWNLYGCHTGDMHGKSFPPLRLRKSSSFRCGMLRTSLGYQGFQQIILKHVESLLEADGKIKGNNTDPWTEIGRPQVLSLTSSFADDADTATSSHRVQSQKVLSDGNRVQASEDRAVCSDSLAPKAWTPI